MKYFGKSTLLLLLCSLLLACDVEESNRNNSQDYGHIDYALKGNWMTQGKNLGHAVDVFYVYPTCWQPENEKMEYCSIDDETMRVRGPIAYQYQGGIFEDIANVFTPWYRQYNIGRLENMPVQAQKAALKAVPYRDVVDAFEYYLKYYNEGRPFILVGHSQGSYILKILLEEYMGQHQELLDRMVAAYALGCSFEDVYFDRNPHLRFATGETDTGVVICWNSERKVNEQFGGPLWGCFSGALSINPISWHHDYEKVEADDERYLGPNTIAEKYSVQVQYDPERDCEVLIVGIDDNVLDSSIGKYCLYGADFSLFTQNIRDNAKKRIYSFMQKEI